MPEAAAGPLGVTEATSAPWALGRPRLSAISGVTPWMRTPSQPRRVWPNSSSWATTVRASAEGMAKPIPTEPPEGEKMAVLMPITSPARLKVGPPELPRLIEASVCRKSS